MSWWISLNNEEGVVDVPSFRAGGTYTLGGSSEADLNVTYNYGKHFNFKELHNMKAKDSIPLFLEALPRLGAETVDDYWEPAPGNVGNTLLILLQWASLYPEAIWEVN